MISSLSHIYKRINLIEKHTYKNGFICGIFQIIVSLIGMVESFHNKFIIYEKISMGQAILLALIFFLSNLTIRKSLNRSRYVLILNSTMCGLISGTMLSLFVFLGMRINMRIIFLNASPNLFQILTLAMNPWLGMAMIFSIMIICGCLAGLSYSLPLNLRNSLITSFGSVFVIGVFQDFIRVLLMKIRPEVSDRINNFLFPFHNGLSLEGALCLFVFFFCLYLLWQWKGAQVKKPFAVFKLNSEKSLKKKKLYLLYFIFLISLPFCLDSYLCEVVDMIGLYLILGLGLNFVVGYAGLLDLGYVAFFAVGSYTMALMTAPDLFHLNFWQALPLSVFFGSVTGVLFGIPILKMRGDYLAIATLGFGEIVRILINSELLKPLLKGPPGIIGIPRASLGTWIFNRPNDIYYLILAGCFLAAWTSLRLNDSRIGRAWKAIREDEDIAQAMGINIVTAKLAAFGIGAGFAALGGAVFAVKVGSVVPSSFSLMVSINIMCLIIIGGLGKVKGVLLGAILLIGLPELFREFAEYRYFLYSIAIMATMLLKPKGLCSDAQP